MVGYKFYAWEYGKLLDPTRGLISVEGDITTGSNAPTPQDSLNCRVVSRRDERK